MLINNKLSLNLELDKLFASVKDGDKILVQLPDGLKPRAAEIQKEIKNRFPNVRLTFWAGSCYGACDVPNINGFDLFVQFGHSEWR